MASQKPNFLRPTNANAASARRFWQGLSEEKLLAQKCTPCGTRFFPPRPVCPSCLGNDLDWVELSGRGTLHSWTKVHLASPEFDTPFFLGLVDLEDGIGRITARIPDADPARLIIGMPVRIGYARLADDFTLYSIALD